MASINFKYALVYLRKGLSPFPVRGKIPLIKWEKYSREKPTEAELIKWWKRWPDANIGIATGNVSGIVVVDVDGGEVPPLPPTAVVETSLNHYQYYFAYPGYPVANSAKVIAPNCDVRGDGGYVVAPPSQHFDKYGNSDHQYVWKIPPKEVGFAPLPEWVVEKIKVKKTVSEIIQGSQEGSRNNDATVVIGSLLSKHPQSEWESICWPLLLGWNEKSNPPLQQVELRNVFESIKGRELQKAFPHSQTLEISRAETNFTPQVLSWKEFMDQESEEQPWLVKDIFKQGWLGVIAGHGKQGKTTLVFHLLNSLNKGLSFITECQKVPVTYINCEMGLGDLRDLIKAVTHDSPDSDTAQIISQVSVPLDISWLELYLSTQATPGVCVIDSFRGAFRLRDDKENQNGAVGNILRSIQTIARRTGWTIIVIHHLRKSGKGDLLDLAGGGEWNSAPDVILTWSCPKPKEPGTLNIVGRVPPHDSYAIRLSRDGVEFLGTVSENQAGEEKRIILESLTDEETSSNNLAETTNIPDSTVRKRLAELFELGSVDRSGLGKKGDPYQWKRV